MRPPSRPDVALHLRRQEVSEAAEGAAARPFPPPLVSGEPSYAGVRSAPGMIPIARPILGEDESAAVKEVLASGMLAQGPKLKASEDAFAADLGRKHGIAVANGTPALPIPLL